MCGVAVGLTSVAVGVILVVRNRSGGGAEEANEGGGGGGGSGGSGGSGDSIGGGGADGRGKYDVVSTKEGDAQLCGGGGARGGSRMAAARCGELALLGIISAMEIMSQGPL